MQRGGERDRGEQIVSRLYSARITRRPPNAARIPSSSATARPLPRIDLPAGRPRSWSSDRCRRCRFRAAQAPGRRIRPRSKSTTLTAPPAVEQDVMCVEIRVVDSGPVKSGDRRPDRGSMNSARKRRRASRSRTPPGDAPRDQIAPVPWTLPSGSARPPAPEPASPVPPARPAAGIPRMRGPASRPSRDTDPRITAP